MRSHSDLVVGNVHTRSNPTWFGIAPATGHASMTVLMIDASAWMRPCLSGDSGRASALCSAILISVARWSCVSGEWLHAARLAIKTRHNAEASLSPTCWFGGRRLSNKNDRTLHSYNITHEAIYSPTISRPLLFWTLEFKLKMSSRSSMKWGAFIFFIVALQNTNTQASFTKIEIIFPEKIIKCLTVTCKCKPP